MMGRDWLDVGALEEGADIPLWTRSVDDTGGPLGVAEEEAE
jgi:hypothetical protein